MRKALYLLAAASALLLTVAGGALTWGEVLAEGEEVIARFGAAL